MSYLGRLTTLWILSSLIISGLCLLIYTAVQQNYRQSLNDPQIQMAEDTAAQLISGTNIDQVVPTQKVDIAASLSPWLAVYNNTGVSLRSSGVLNGAAPKLPTSLFDDSAWLAQKTYETPYGKETRITWQPQPDVRQAIVIVHLNGSGGMYGFIVAGRNMREVEDRESQLGFMVGLAWLGLMGVTLVWSALAVRFILN